MEKNEYIEFKILDETKFEGFGNLFKLISESKKSGDYKSDEFWLEKFPDEALVQYYFAESDLKPKLQTADNEGGTWHFYTMMEHLLENLDVELMNCEKIGESRGKLNFYAYGYPYGGITGMTMFLNSFGFKATKIDEGCGVYRVAWKNETEFELKEVKSTVSNGHGSLWEKIKNKFQI